MYWMINFSFCSWYSKSFFFLWICYFVFIRLETGNFSENYPHLFDFYPFAQASIFKPLLWGRGGGQGGGGVRFFIPTLYTSPRPPACTRCTVGTSTPVSVTFVVWFGLFILSRVEAFNILCLSGTVFVFGAGGEGGGTFLGLAGGSSGGR